MNNGASTKMNLALHLPAPHIPNTKKEAPCIIFALYATTLPTIVKNRTAQKVCCRLHTKPK